MTRTATTLTRAVIALPLTVLALTGCGSTPSRAPIPGAAAHPAPAATVAPTATTAPVTAKSPAATGDPISALEGRVAVVGIRTTSLLGPARDTRGALTVAGLSLPLTPEAGRRYVADLPANGHDEATDLKDGSAWQLVAHSAFTPGDTVRALDGQGVLAGPLNLKESRRVVLTNGGRQVSFDATQVYAFTTVSTGAKVYSTFARHYVLTLTPGSTPNVPWMISSWTGTGTDSSPTRSTP